MTEAMLINELKQLPIEKRFFILRESMYDLNQNESNELLASALKLKSYYEDEAALEFNAIDGDSFYEAN